MFREFVILLFAGTFVCSRAVRTAGQTAPAPTSVAAQEQDHLALPSEGFYQNVAPPSSKYLPTQTPSYQVNSAVVDTISESTSVKSVPVQSYGTPNAQQQKVIFSASVASDPSSPEYKNLLERYIPNVKPINPYYIAPVAAKTVTIGSQGAPNTQGHNVRPVLVYTNNAAPSRPYYVVPQQKTEVESYRTVNIQSPSSYGAPTQNVVYTTNSALQSSPPVASYHVNQVQAVAVNSPVPQYVPAPSVTYNVNPAVKTYSVPAVPVTSNKVTIEAYNSVMTHPPPAPKYAHVPVPVPVLYQTVETHQPAAQQYVQAPARGQLIPVAANPGGIGLQFHSIPVSGGHQHGYAKAVLYSPASEVSRVTFNGLGVTYGW